MSLFSIADLHLSLSVNKPMDKFGSRWTNYTEKLEQRWRAVVGKDDTVIVPGDISWAIDLDEALADLQFIDALPGSKILGKGNHDYWWSTIHKMETFLNVHDLGSIRFLQNNAFEVEDYIITGTRGWYLDEKQQTEGNANFSKVVSRENIRLRLCLEEAKKLQDSTGKPILVYFHFPPVYRSFVCRELIDTLHAYEIKNCYFGHIHGTYNIPRTITFEDISMTMISADFLDFVPMITMPFMY